MLIKLEKSIAFFTKRLLFTYMNFYEFLEGASCYVWQRTKIINSWGAFLHQSCKEGDI